MTIFLESHSSNTCVDSTITEMPSLPTINSLSFTFSRVSALFAVFILMSSSSSSATAFSAKTTANSKSGTWSESAIQLARELTLSQREKLLAEEGVCKPREIRIVAQVLDPTQPETWIRDSSEEEVLATKIVHFQRHGQGFHNLLGDILRDAGLKPSVDSEDPAINPWLRPEIVDSPLTETGKDQCRDQCAVASQLRPQLVIVSPLLRAIQTAQLTFAEAYQDSSIPWMVHEGVREELGVLVCNKRRPTSQIQADFPRIQFPADMPEDDLLWTHKARESAASKSERIYDFLVNCLMEQEVSELAVIGHSATLFHMCNAILEPSITDNDSSLEEEQGLQAWFMTSEIRSLRLSFLRNPEYSSPE